MAPTQHGIVIAFLSVFLVPELCRHDCTSIVKVFLSSRATTESYEILTERRPLTQTLRKKVVISAWKRLTALVLESKLPIAARWGTWAPCGLRVETADPIRFMAGCHKRRLNQALSVLSLRLRFFSVFCVVHHGHFLCCVILCLCFGWSD